MAKKLKMDGEFNLEVLKGLRNKLICSNGHCKEYINPGETVYSKTDEKDEEMYNCQKCVSRFETLEFKKNHTATEFIAGFNKGFCKNNKEGCKKEIPMENMKNHEDRCKYQLVDCPYYYNCMVSYKYIDSHRDEHVNDEEDPTEIIDVKDQWEFEGEFWELFGASVRLSSYDQTFFPRFDNESLALIPEHFFISVRMMAYPDEVHFYKFSISFHVGEVRNALTIEDFVYSICKAHDDMVDIDNCLVRIPSEKVTKYYDPDTKEFKTQEKVRFTLKITNAKLDEVRKDESIESGVEDN